VKKLLKLAGIGAVIAGIVKRNGGAQATKVKVVKTARKIAENPTVQRVIATGTAKLEERRTRWSATPDAKRRTAAQNQTAGQAS
jgi:hypothetical protein